jgi:predicted GNAT superfamily acetyltransferase
MDKQHEHYQIRILEKPEEMFAVEDLQGIIWPGDAREIVPSHLLLSAVSSGGLVIGAYNTEAPQGTLVGFVFGYPGLYTTPDGPRPKHSSHMMGVHPDHRNQGLGFTLKRAQWQMVRTQGLDRITWTYDPLLSRNAHLNITRLGAVCNTYYKEFYGEMRDGLNVGLPSDRFQVDWWVNSERVVHRLSRQARRKLDLAHFLAAGTELLNPTRVNDRGLPMPTVEEGTALEKAIPEDEQIVLVEIPADYQHMRTADPGLALEWRIHSRGLLSGLFARGYLVTDFVHLPGSHARSFYVLTHGKSTL